MPAANALNSGKMKTGECFAQRIIVGSLNRHFGVMRGDKQQNRVLCGCAGRYASGATMPNRGRSTSRHQCPHWRRCEQDFGGVVEPWGYLRRMSSQEICGAVNRVHRFRSRRWGPKERATL
jgi:hypothetical protein